MHCGISFKMMLIKPFQKSMEYLSLNKGLINKLRRVVPTNFIYIEEQIILHDAHSDSYK